MAVCSSAFVLCCSLFNFLSDFKGSAIGLDGWCWWSGALIGKSLDDEFDLKLPEGEASYLITEVRYDVIK